MVTPGFPFPPITVPSPPTVPGPDFPAPAAAGDGATEPEQRVIEQRVIAEFNTASVAVGSSVDFAGEFTDLSGVRTTFAGLVILQVEIDSPDLANTDTVTLELFRSGTRRSPDELIARFSGTSQITAVWKSIFSDQLIEYFDRAGESQIYATLSNPSGNSTSGIFHLLITARKVQ